jgi:hypothetical protein
MRTPMPAEGSVFDWVFDTATDGWKGERSCTEWAFAAALVACIRTAVPQPQSLGLVPRASTQTPAGDARAASDVRACRTCFQPRLAGVAQGRAAQPRGRLRVPHCAHRGCGSLLLPAGAPGGRWAAWVDVYVRVRVRVCTCGCAGACLQVCCPHVAVWSHGQPAVGPRRAAQWRMRRQAIRMSALVPSHSPDLLCLHLQITSGFPVLLVGPTGTGKSAYVKAVLTERLDRATWANLVFNFSAQTSANMTQVRGLNRGGRAGLVWNQLLGREGQAGREAGGPACGAVPSSSPCAHGHAPGTA